MKKQPKARQPRGIQAPPRPVECPFCDHEEKSKMAMGFHLMKTHPVFIPGASKPKCDSCGLRVDFTQTVYKQNEVYDGGFCPGIGNNCGCLERFQSVGYQTIAEIARERDALENDRKNRLGL